jgi:hypothetical protein
MRQVLALAVALLFLVGTQSALAASLCDPAGKLCIQIDTSTARVCAPLRPGGWNTATCEQEDGQRRNGAKQVEEGSHGVVKEVDALVIRFEDWTAQVALYRGPGEPEVTGDAGAVMSLWTQAFTHDRKSGWMFEEVKAPVLSRINGAQVARQELRLSSAGIGGAMIGHAVAYEVRSRDWTYLVVFSGDEREAAHVTAMADLSMGTLDTLPAASATSPVDALVWLLRALVAAALLVGLGWLVSRLRGRPSGIDSRDLWPR